MYTEKRIVVVHVIVPKDQEMPKAQPPVGPGWLQLLAFWLYLRAMRPPLEKEVALVRTLAVVTVLLLIVLALIAVGASDVVADVLRAWPTIP